MRLTGTKKLIIATHNGGKRAEFVSLFKPYGIEVVSAGDLGLPEPAETEDSFRGNARIKAEAAMRATGLLAIADDSGLCVAALDGAPGVYTADWAGPDRNWLVAMERVEGELAARGAVLPGQRQASFMCTLCVMWPSQEVGFYEGEVPGSLIWPPRGKLGHGYDPVFVPRGQSQTFAEMSDDDKNLISHRSVALKKLSDELL